MFKFLLSNLRMGEPACRPRNTSRAWQDLRLQWRRDPLSHPAIKAMSERERGDLPFRR